MSTNAINDFAAKILSDLIAAAKLLDSHVDDFSYNGRRVVHRVDDLSVYLDVGWQLDGGRPGSPICTVEVTAGSWAWIDAPELYNSLTHRNAAEVGKAFTAAALIAKKMNSISKP